MRCHINAEGGDYVHKPTATWGCFSLDGLCHGGSVRRRVLEVRARRGLVTVIQLRLAVHQLAGQRVGTGSVISAFD